MPGRRLDHHQNGLPAEPMSGSRLSPPSFYFRPTGEPAPSQGDEGLSRRLCAGILVTVLKTLIFLPQTGQIAMRMTRLLFMVLFIEIATQCREASGATGSPSAAIRSCIKCHSEPQRRIRVGLGDPTPKTLRYTQGDN